MIYPEPRLLPAGDAALLVDWADEIDDELNERVHALAHQLRSHPHPALTDLVPAYASLLVCFDPQRTTMSTLREWVAEALATAPSRLSSNSRLVEIPTRYGGEFGPDLAFIAAQSGLTEQQVIAQHTGVIYRVYMIGFSPGFAYLGTVPAVIAAPRLETPRVRVPAGSVGIAGRQTGIYPTETPGGWRLIGRTEMRLFAIEADPPSLLQPGDRVRFVRVD